MPNDTTPSNPRKRRLLTTDVGIPTSTYNMPDEAVRKLEALEPINISNDRAARAGGWPDDPTVIHIADKVNLVVGVYIMPAQTASGKTLLSLALVGWANATGTPASYISCFEPRSPEWQVGSTKVFVDPGNFISDLRKCIGTGNATPKLLIIDSGTLPMKAKSGKSPWTHQSTFAGGMQPSDRAFLDDLAKVAKDTQACIIVVINSSLIPYTSQLEGGCEGQIRVRDIGSFNYTDRTKVSRRRTVRVTVPVEYVNAITNHFGFGDYTGSGDRGSTSGYRGI